MGEAAHFNSEILELGNVAKGLSGSTGDGEGDWRLELTSDPDIQALAYVRTDDGFLTTMHESAVFEDGRQPPPMFNPGSNPKQAGRLRLANPPGSILFVTVIWTDDAGRAPARQGAARVTLPAKGAVTLSAADLEAGVVSGPSEWDGWDYNALGDGTGKWRMSVNSASLILTMSFLQSPTGT